MTDSIHILSQTPPSQFIVIDPISTFLCSYFLPLYYILLLLHIFFFTLHSLFFPRSPLFLLLTFLHSSPLIPSIYFVSSLSLSSISLLPPFPISILFFCQLLLPTYCLHTFFLYMLPYLHLPTA